MILVNYYAVFDKKSDEWEHVRKLSESRIVQTYNPIIYKYRSIDISAYVDNCKEMPERGKYIYINNFDRTLDIIKNNTYYENYSLRYEYEQKIETLNDKIEEQQKEIEDKENKIMELENIIEDYKYN